MANSLLRFIGTGMAISLASTNSSAQAANPNGPLPRLIDKLLSPQPKWAAVEEFDVAGVRLGMDPQEARAALKAKGFTPHATDPLQDSWAAKLSQKVSDRLGGQPDTSKVTMFTMAEGPQGEHVEVWYAATSKGARATEIKYQIPTNRMTSINFLSGVDTKYGEATVAQKISRLYCSKGETSCVSYQNKQLPYLTATVDYNFLALDLMVGTNARDDAGKIMSAAVEAAAPRNAKASF